MAQGKLDIQILRPASIPGVELQAGTAITGDVPRHWHEEYQLCAITGGYGEMRYRGATCRNPAGTLNLVEPGEVHSNETRHSGGCDFLKLDFDPALFQLVGEQPPRSAFSAPTTCDSATFQRFLHLHRLLRHPSDPLEQQAAFLSFLAFLLQRHMRSRVFPKPARREPRAVAVVRSYLEANYSCKIDLRHLAALTGLSAFHLTRVFTRETGLPPHAFLRQIRISRAKELLRGRRPISAVALETGFADQSHLTRAFQSIVRISPAVYRREQQESSRLPDTLNAKWSHA